MFDRKIIRFLFNNFGPHIIIKINFQNIEEIFVTSSQKDPVVTDRLCKKMLEEHNHLTEIYDHGK
jgi:hypothetical protein